MDKEEKEKFFSSALTALSRHHFQNCLPYRKMMNSINFDPQNDYSITALPFLPVRLFGMVDFFSIPRDKVVKTLTSSGTGGQSASRIYLDKETTLNQTKVLAGIVNSFIGKKRIPMIIADSESVFKDRNLLSANAAAISGFSLFGTEKFFVLNERMELDSDLLNSFMTRHTNEKILIFGFTFKIWQYFYKGLLKAGIKPDLSRAVLIHGGGWKRMENESVTSSEFKNRLHEVCGIRQIHNYYGMAEQTGSIFMECEYGHLHTSVYSDIIIRRSRDFSVANPGEEGIIQVLSVLPGSYPGHSLLTEDTGVLLGEDDCSCKRLGKYFVVTGRMKQAEIRGCSDAYDGNKN